MEADLLPGGILNRSRQRPVASLMPPRLRTSDLHRQSHRANRDADGSIPPSSPPHLPEGSDTQRTDGDLRIFPSGCPGTSLNPPRSRSRSRSAPRRVHDFVLSPYDAVVAVSGTLEHLRAFHSGGRKLGRLSARVLEVRPYRGNVLNIRTY